MNNETNQSENLQLLTELEQRLSSLLDRYKQLAQENHILKQQQEKLSSEKASLDEKHHKVHLKIETILKQLKALEQQ